MSDSPLWLCRKCYTKFKPDNERNLCPNCGSLSTIEIKSSGKADQYFGTNVLERKMIRKWIDDTFDNLIEDSTLMQKNVEIISEGLGFEPSLESILMYFLGLCTGNIMVMAEVSGINRDDTTIEMLPHIYTRLFELRKHLEKRGEKDLN